MYIRVLVIRTCTPYSLQLPASRHSSALASTQFTGEQPVHYERGGLEGACAVNRETKPKKTADALSISLAHHHKFCRLSTRPARRCLAGAPLAIAIAIAIAVTIKVECEGSRHSVLWPTCPL